MLFHQHNEATDPEADVKVSGRRVTWADALTELARRSLDGDESPTRRERFRINLFIHPDSNGGAEWVDRSAVPDYLVDKLTCDGRVTPTFVDDAKPVSVGRALRIVPDRARRLVLYRDGHKCRIPWCQRTGWLEVHHVVHWKDGGPTDTDNLISACGGCHTAIHDRRLNITGNANHPFGLTFTDRHSNPIDYRTPTPPAPTGSPPTPERPYPHPLGERLDHNDVWVNPSRAG